MRQGLLNSMDCPWIPNQRRNLKEQRAADNMFDSGKDGDETHATLESELPLKYSN